MQPNEIDLVLQRNTYASQAATPYQAAIGGALDQDASIGPGDMRNVLNQLEMMSQANLQIAMTELGPMLYDDMTAAALSGASVFSNTLRNRFRELHGATGIDCRGHDQVWVKDFSNWSSEAGLPTEPPGYRYNAMGGAVGMERCFGDEVIGGMSIGYSGTLAMGYAALEYFEEGGDVSGIAQRVKDARDKAVTIARERLGKGLAAEEPLPAHYVTVGGDAPVAPLPELPAAAPAPASAPAASDEAEAR